MKNWRETLVASGQTVLSALAAIERASTQIALVVDEQQRLLGVVTDGDIRKHILAGHDLNVPVDEVMNRNPVSGRLDDDRQQLLTRMSKRSIHQIPLLDDAGRVVGLAIVDDLLAIDTQPNLVVLMAGGRGIRLRPLTETCPKPMLKVGRRPILETIILQFAESGFSRFAISVNYLAETIKDHFGDGSRLGVEISYLHEDVPLGTAGALTLLPERPREPFFVMNGDLLTKLNFSSLLAFHREHRSPLTMCVREHTLNVPYGVAEVQGNHLKALVEKPSYRKLVNAGIYVCDPDTLDLLKPGRPATMVDLATTLLQRKRPPAVFPIHEYWVDIGHHRDFAQASADFEENFA